MEKTYFNRNPPYVDTSKNLEKSKIFKIACFFNWKSRILIDHFLYFVSDSPL